MPNDAVALNLTPLYCLASAFVVAIVVSFLLGLWIGRGRIVFRFKKELEP